MTNRGVGLLVAIAVVCAAGLAAGYAWPNDLGKYGETFPIIEVDLLTLMSSKLHALQANGQLDRLNRTLMSRAQAKVEHPAPVAGVSTTEKPASFLYDPTYVVQQDIADEKGRVFAHRGDRINALERLPSFNRTLLFIDARDPRQVKRALDLHKRLGAESLVVILTAGAPMELMRQAGFRVGFDQAGLLTSKLGITHVPAVVARQGNALKIDEVMP